MKIRAHFKTNASQYLRLLQISIFSFFSFIAIYFLYLRLHWIQKTNFPPTADGFFYLQEIKHRLNYGTGYYTSKSVFFSIISLLSFLTTIQDESILYKITAIFSLLIFSGSLIIPLVKKREFWLIPAIFLLPWVSDLLFYRYYAFLRQFFSISLLFLGISMFLSANDLKKKQKVLIYGLACVFLLFSILTHIFSLGILFTLLAIEIIRSAEYRKTKLIFCAFFGALLTVSSFSRGLQIFNFPEQLELPWQTFCRITHCVEFELFEFILYTGLFLILLVFINRKDELFYLYFPLLSVILIFNIPIWDIRSEFVYRTTLVSVSLITFTFSLFIYFSNEVRQYYFLFLPMLLAIGYFFFNHGTPREALMPSNKLIQYKESLKTWIDKDSFVTAPHGMQFKITYFLERASAREVPLNKDYSNIYSYRSASLLSTNCQNLNSPEQIISETVACVTIENKWGFLKLK